DRSLLLSLNPLDRSFRRAEEWPLSHGDADLIEPLLATGRARLREPNGIALRLGNKRALAFSWELDAGGNQTLVAGIGTGHVFGAAWEWYLDAASGEIGRTDAGKLAPFVNDLVSMPDMLPEHVAEAQRALKKRGVASLLPPPHALEVEVARAAQPRALLTLSRPPHDHEPDRLRHGVHARLVFIYDGQSIEPHDPRSELRTRKGESVLLLRREPEFENLIARVLAREGFNAVAQHHYYGYHASAHHTAPIQARVWQRPHPLAGPAIETWARGLVDRCEKFGLTIEAGEDFPVFLGVELGAPELVIEADDEQSSDWFTARLGIELDGVRIDLIPILLRALSDPTATTARGLRVTLPDGRPALVPHERLAAVLALIRDLESRGDSLGVPRAHLAAIVPPPDWRFVPGAEARAFLEEIERFRGLESIAPPPSFVAELRPYQSVGLAWLDFLRRFRFGGVLADDMGLGKTVQLLAHLALERAEGRLDKPALVICPTSVAPNWLAETHRFAPELRVVQLARGDRSATLATLDQQDLVITSYALLLRDAEVLAQRAWSVVVFDEAQWLKNSASLSYRAAVGLKADRKLCLTGTPVENHLGELKAQLDLVVPGLLGDDRRFAKHFRTPIERERDADAAVALRRRVRPFLLRRTKEQVAPELPPRTLIEHSVELGGAQRDLYETIRVQMEKRVRDALIERGFARSRITVLDALLKLRQVCCDPQLVKLPSARTVKESAKREALMDLLPTLIEDGRSILLFSQFTSMLDLIEIDLKQRAQPFLRLDGNTVDRRAPVERFQRGEAPLFLVSLKAGGVGLNLTRADTVILYDPWWNPAAEAQAIDRAHRIGQDKPVFVYELNCVGTVEEKMQALKARKRAVADAVLATGEAALESLGPDDLMALFAAA
ncbi:MAG: DEAD/DEAH box helicase, partial [Lysobacterales bacterium]